MKLQGATTPRPLTHDLLVNILSELDVSVVRVTVTELRESTFHASITVAQNGTELEIDSRSSDAIAVAVRTGAPIFADDEVIEESAIEMEGDEVNEEEIVDEFKRFLDRVSAEDFAGAEAEAEAEELEDEQDDEESDSGVDVDRGAERDLAVDTRCDPHRNADAAMRGRVRRHVGVAVHGEPAQKVVRVVQSTQSKPVTLR